MVYTSQNGYTAAPTAAGIPGGVVSISVEGTRAKFRVRAGDVATVFQYLIEQYHARVENIDLYSQGDDWSYYFRPIRSLLYTLLPNQTGFCGDISLPNSVGVLGFLASSTSNLSNHSSATAVDINATRHPLATQPSSNFTAAQIATIHTIVNKELAGVIKWGGDYVRRKDGMHFEINAPLSEVSVVARKIRDLGGYVPPVPVVQPTMDLSDLLAAIKAGRKSSLIEALQTALKKHGFAVSVDGWWGLETKGAVSKAQIKLCGAVPGTSGADGIPGRQSLTALGFKVVA